MDSPGQTGHMIVSFRFCALRSMSGTSPSPKTVHAESKNASAASASVFTGLGFGNSGLRMVIRSTRQL